MFTPKGRFFTPDAPVPRLGCSQAGAPVRRGRIGLWAGLRGAGGQLLGGGGRAEVRDLLLGRDPAGVPEPEA